MAVQSMFEWKRGLSDGGSKVLAFTGGVLASLLLVGVLIGLVAVNLVTPPAFVGLGVTAIVAGYLTPYYVAYWMAGPSASESDEGVPAS